jgi:beta-galactosidase GanA
MYTPVDMRKLMKIVEQNEEKQRVKNPSVLAVDISSYNLSKLLQSFRGEAESYGKAGDSALVTFYTEQEKQAFEAYLRSQGVSFQNIEDEGGTEEPEGTNTTSLMMQYNGPIKKK